MKKSTKHLPRESLGNSYNSVLGLCMSLRNIWRMRIFVLICQYYNFLANSCQEIVLVKKLAQKLHINQTFSYLVFVKSD